MSINTNRLRNPNSHSLKVLHTEKHPPQTLDPLFKKLNKINEPTLANLKLRITQNLQEKSHKQEESSDSSYQKTLRVSQSGGLK